MPPILKMSEFTFVGETLAAVSEMVYDEVIKAPELSMLHQIYPGIVAKKELGFIGEGGLVGKANQGCDPTPQDWNIDTRKVTFDPVTWEVLIHQCWTDLESAATVYSLATGISIPDFTTSDYMAIVTTVLATALKDFIIRLLWFNDKDAEHIADDGDYTNGLDLSYFNLLDGFWKQLAELIAANPLRHVAIDENGADSYALQVLPPSKVQGYLQRVKFGADLRLRGQSNGAMYVTQTVYDAYAMSLQGVNLESMYANLVNGQRTLTFDGTPVIPIPTWDKMIRAFQDTGAKHINPHRIVYAVKDTFGVAVDSESSFTDLRIWYNQDDRKVKIEAMGRADAKIITPFLIQVGL